MVDSSATHYFSDSDVESHFSISVSKLRTAQRLRLVEAQIGDRNRRQTRHWSAHAVLRVWTAELISRHSGLPFNVGVGICVTATPERWVPVERAAFGNGGEHEIPTIIIVDREIVVAEEPDGSWIFVGTIKTADDNRMLFEPGDRQPYLTNGGPHISEFRFNFAASTVEFCRIYIHLTDTP